MASSFTSITIFLVYVFGAFAFLVGAMLFGTGVGFIIRARIDAEALLFVLIAVVIFVGVYILHRLAAKSLRSDLKSIRNAGWTTGGIAFVSVFIYYAMRATGS